MKLLEKYKKQIKILNFASLVILFFAWIFFYVATGGATVPFWIIFSISAILLGLLIAVEREAILRFLNKRVVHKAFVNILSLVVLISILIVIYVISMNFPIRFDLTQNKSYTLSQQTREMLSRVNDPLSIVALRNQSTDSTSAEWVADLLLREYSKVNKNVTLEYINPIEKPSARTTYQMTQLGEIVFTYKNGKQVRVYKNDLVSRKEGEQSLFVGEEKFTQAILTLLEQENFVVYFTTGHGERQIADRGGDGLSFVKTYLENENYQVKNLNIVLENIPTDASLIVIASPIEPFSDFELKKIDEYLNNGGRIFLMYDSVLDRRDFKSNLDGWLLTRGFKVNKDYIIDPVSSVVVPVNVVPQYTTHSITKTLKEGNILSCFVVARSILKTNTKYQANFETVLNTTPRGYGKLDATFDLERARFNPSRDIAGPVSLAIVATYNVQGTESIGKLAVFGDATFSLNAYINPSQGNSYDVAFSGNKDLFMNTVAYLLDARSKITIRPKENDIKHLALTTTQTNFIRYMAQIGLPILFGILGILVWFIRRR